MPLLEPKSVTITTNKGEKNYILSKFPAIAGREIVAKYPLSGLPKVGEYSLNEETMLKLMSYVAVPIEGKEPLQLVTRELVDNHVPDWEALAKLEIGMMEYNVSFFGRGVISSFLEDITRNMPAWITKIATVLSAQSSQKEKQPLKN